MSKPRVEIGQKVHADFGAMHPIVEGMITNIEITGLVTWETEEGDTYHTKVNEFKQVGETSVNGSPIGVFLGEY